MNIITLQAIKTEAICLFAEKGYEGTSIKDITSPIGITPPGFYAHFSSKEELFLQLLKECLIERMESIKGIIEKSDTKFSVHTLYEIYLSYIHYYMQKSNKKTFILRNMLCPPSELREKTFNFIMDHMKQVNGLTANVFRQCMKEKEIIAMPAEEHLSKFYRLIFGYLFEIMTFRKDIVSEDIEKEWNFYWSGIKDQK